MKAYKLMNRKLHEDGDFKKARARSRFVSNSKKRAVKHAGGVFRRNKDTKMMEERKEKFEQRQFRNNRKKNKKPYVKRPYRKPNNS